MSAQGEPVSQIFLSCDLTGSTTFKQQPDRYEPWQKVFLQFYRDFPQQIAITQVETEAEHLTFRLWKTVGDELIYTCTVRTEQDVVDAVRTWTLAMQKYEASGLNDTTMGTKGGAFIATFPGPDSRASVPRLPNTEDSDADVVLLNNIALTEQDHEKYLYDYFGPSIDIGFRVLNKCTPRYFVLSVEVALAMLGSGHADNDVSDLLLREFAKLKGVWSGQRYPVVAVDTLHHDPVNRAYAKFERRGGVDDLAELCLACYRSPNWPSKLYLPESGNELFRAVPTDPLARYLNTASELAEQAAVDDDDYADLDADAPLGG